MVKSLSGGKQVKDGFTYEIINERKIGSEKLQLIRVSIHNKSNRNRKKTIQAIMDETGATGFIEWWARGA